VTATNTGTVWRNCLECQIASNFVNTGAKPVTSDLQALLYNLRFGLSHCLFDFGTNPCITSTACEPLQNALQYENLAPNVTSYGYCSTWSALQVPKCNNCIRAMDGGAYLSNYLSVLDGACNLQLQPPATIPLDGDIFDPDEQVQVSNPSATAGPTGSYSVGPFSYGQLAGVVIGGVLVLLLIMGCGVVINGKRRRKAYLKKRGQMHKNWPAGNGNGGEMFETPVSQRPLRGWGDSPVSAVDTEHTFQNNFYSTPVTQQPGSSLEYQLQLQQQQQQQQPQQQAFPRYFSPYATPVESTKNVGWPAEKQQQQHGQEIGVAVSPDHDEVVYWGDQKGKMRLDGDHDEYELQEGVGSGGGHQQYYPPPPTFPQAPVLNHPGYGRHGNTPPGTAGR